MNLFRHNKKFPILLNKRKSYFYNYQINNEIEFDDIDLTKYKNELFEKELHQELLKNKNQQNFNITNLIMNIKNLLLLIEYHFMIYLKLCNTVIKYKKN
jgi:hypothetical protein